jgi:hypothetical protein
LRVAGYNCEGKLRSGRVVFSHEVEKAFADAYALIIGENHKPTDSIIKRAHLDFHDGYERYGLAFVECNIVLREGAEFRV